MKFISEYKDLVARIRYRHGLEKQSCRVDLKQLEDFLNRKHMYEKTFRQFAPSGKLHKVDLLEYFNRCDLWPTQREINNSFDTIFRGSRNTAEVVFLLDCSTSTGIVGFHNLIKFVQDLVRTLDIAPDKTRVGVVPFNEDIFSSFSLSKYDNKKELLEAISRVKLWHGLTRTDLALRVMRGMFKDSRPGVQKIGLVLTDGQSTYNDKTIKEAQLSHEMGIQMFAIGMGSKVDLSELQHIATNPDSLFHIHDAGSLGVIRRQIEKRLCLDIPQYTPIKASSTSHICRPIDQSEALEVIWTCYPPLVCGITRSSRWIRPIVKGKEAWSLLDDDIIRATGMKACLRLVIQSRLQRHGYITVPSDVRDDVEQVTSETEALQIIEKFIEDQMKSK
ncbi:collagen alpha-1(XIV) chain-like [Ruditapes philippinarum]|uniref:collagen alpha-1(XIV) chain-like n=1 Tax=Ruditapes philippinarum TaxID=129788 RepID=UPI00295BE4AA|nr:collagen alpha-1(XIV) chain-like [Ruditapes philippinarum]